MSKNPPVFRSIAAPLEVPDEVLHALGDQLGVPKMVKPEPVLAPKIDTSPSNSRGEAVSAADIAPPPTKENPAIAQDRAFDALSRVTDPLSTRNGANPGDFNAARTHSPRPTPGYADRRPSLRGQSIQTVGTPSATAEKVTIMLPPYLTAALRRESAERRITIRTLVVMGLQAIGFDVDDRDLSPDFRRERSRGN